jgi:hypothetical protein
MLVAPRGVRLGGEADIGADAPERQLMTLLRQSEMSAFLRCSWRPSGHRELVQVMAIRAARSSYAKCKIDPVLEWTRIALAAVCAIAFDTGEQHFVTRAGPPIEL